MKKRYEGSLKVSLQTCPKKNPIQMDPHSK